jgi:hypothetical protein
MRAQPFPKDGLARGMVLSTRQIGARANHDSTFRDLGEHVFWLMISWYSGVRYVLGHNLGTTNCDTRQYAR